MRPVRGHRYLPRVQAVPLRGLSQMCGVRAQGHAPHGEGGLRVMGGKNVRFDPPDDMGPRTNRQSYRLCRDCPKCVLGECAVTGKRVFPGARVCQYGLRLLRSAARIDFRETKKEKAKDEPRTEK